MCVHSQNLFDEKSMENVFASVLLGRMFLTL